MKPPLHPPEALQAVRLDEPANSDKIITDTQQVYKY